MPNYPFPCTDCGQPVKGYVTGNRHAANRYAAYLKSQGRLCPACFRAYCDSINSIAAADPNNANLPRLKGSERQVALASQVRLSLLPFVAAAQDTVLGQIRSNTAGLSPMAVEEMEDAVFLIASELRKEADAGLWIDRRHWTGDCIVWHIKQAIVNRRVTLCPTTNRKTQGEVNA